MSDEAKFQVLALADVYVSSSHHEGFGIVFLEGLSQGLPVVCYDNGGQTDYLRDGRTGYLVKAGDLDGLTAKLAALCTDADLRATMSRHNRDYANRFYINACAARYLEIYESTQASADALVPA